MLTQTTQTDTSYVIGVLIMTVLALVALGIGVFLGATTERGGKGSKVAVGAGSTAVMWLVLGLLFTWAAWPPLPGPYNTYRLATGTVRSVGNRFIASDTQGGGSTEKFAVQFTTGQTFGCNDTRCSTLKPGQLVSLWCEPVFQFNASEGYDCNFAWYGKQR